MTITQYQGSRQSFQIVCHYELFSCQSCLRETKGTPLFEKQSYILVSDCKIFFLSSWNGIYWGESPPWGWNRKISADHSHQGKINQLNVGRHHNELDQVTFLLQILLLRQQRGCKN